jgi:hypothetical protein
VISKAVGHIRTDDFALTLRARRSAVAQYDSRLCLTAA